MTKKKSIFSKLFVALVALTLISCCFLGSTFARYTSSGTGKANADVANWQISITGAGVGTQSVTISGLKPAADAYEGEARSNTMEAVNVAAITNAGEVNAIVTFTLGNMVVYGLESDGVTASETPVAAWGNYSESAVKDLFEVKLYYTTDATFAEDNAIISGEPIDAALQRGTTYYIWVQVTWNTDDSNSATDDGRAADALDTWVGQNVGALGWNLTYTAVQAD